MRTLEKGLDAAAKKYPAAAARHEENSRARIRKLSLLK